jgi:hypothetical protein
VDLFHVALLLDPVRGKKELKKELKGLPHEITATVSGITSEALVVGFLRVDLFHVALLHGKKLIKRIVS